MKRVEYLDNAKFLAIILMVLGHCSIIKYHFTWIGAFIYSFHMPLFFVISGLLFNPIDIKSALKKYTNNMLRPYFFTLLFAMIIFLIISPCFSELSYGEICSDFFQRMVWGSAIFIHGSVWGDVPRSMALWFLPAMFWGLLFLTMIEKLIQNQMQKILIVLIIFFSSCISITIIRLPLAIQQGGSALLYLFVGYTIKQKGDMDSFFNWEPFTCILALFLWFLAIYLGGISMGECNYGGGISQLLSLQGHWQEFIVSCFSANLLIKDILSWGGIPYT